MILIRTVTKYKTLTKVHWNWLQISRSVSKRRIVFLKRFCLINRGYQNLVVPGILTSQYQVCFFKENYFYPLMIFVQRCDNCNFTKYHYFHPRFLPDKVVQQHWSPNWNSAFSSKCCKTIGKAWNCKVHAGRSLSTI